MSQLYVPCFRCNSDGVRTKLGCGTCCGVGFIPVGMSLGQLEMLVKNSPERARIMRDCLLRIEQFEAFFAETKALVSDARQTLDAVGR